MWADGEGATSHLGTQGWVLMVKVPHPTWAHRVWVLMVKVPRPTGCSHLQHRLCLQLSAVAYLGRLWGLLERAILTPVLELWAESLPPAAASSCCGHTGGESRGKDLLSLTPKEDTIKHLLRHWHGITILSERASGEDCPSEPSPVHVGQQGACPWLLI